MPFTCISNDQKYFLWNEESTEYWERVRFLEVSVTYFIIVLFYVGNIREGQGYMKLPGSKNMVCLS